METPDDCEAAAIERELGYCESRAHAEKRAARLSRSVEAVIAHRRLADAYDSRAQRLQCRVENHPYPAKE